MGKKNRRGNVAIITGASSGMGREFALEIASGYASIGEIWLIARRKEKLLELAQKIKGKRVRILAMDVTSEEELQKLEALLAEKKPLIRMVVNGAGMGKIGTFQEMTRKDSQDMVTVNCQAVTNITRMVLPYMGEESTILQMASSSAFMPQPEFAVYAASKSYVLSFSRALNRELAPRHIQVTAVCPGPVDTEFFQTAQTYHQVKAYKKLAMAKPEKVVRRALLDAKHGKEVSTYGACMKGFRVISKIIPHSILLKFVG